MKKERGALQHSWAHQRAGGYDCFSVTILRPAARHFFPEEVNAVGGVCPGPVMALRDGGCGAGHDLRREALSSRPERHVPVWVTPIEVTRGAGFWS